MAELFDFCVVVVACACLPLFLMDEACRGVFVPTGTCHGSCVCPREGNGKRLLDLMT